MATINDITGDAIRSKKPSTEYDRGFGAIDWSVKLGGAEVPTAKPVVTPEDWDEDRMDIIGQNGNDGESYVTEQ